jgi:aldose sugar dehydrogenase
MSKVGIFVSLIMTLAVLLSLEATKYTIYAEEEGLPFISKNTANLAIERVSTGINYPTSMAFLGPNDILILERESGKVYRIVNGQMLDEPVIDVGTYYKDGLIGIATTQNQTGSQYVFLYYNEAPIKYGNDIDGPEEAEMVNHTLGYFQEGDRLYRYEVIDNKLVNPRIILNLHPAQSNKGLGQEHHGGEVIIGSDGIIYIATGDLQGLRYDEEKTKAQNYKEGKEPDGRAGILRITQEGEPVDQGILGNTHPLNLYYAYGIRNSFGLDFDPVTGNLWDTENGPDYGDEINLVEPGFNSGADVVQGISSKYDDLDGLVDFNGKGQYSDPEFVWTIPVGPTAIKFFNSDKFGAQFRNDMFVADVNHGNIYHFDLNKDRTGLSLKGPLEDKVADKPAELKDVLFARNFGGITDMEVGPDGYLYIVSLEGYLDDRVEGTIYRIVPKN